MANHKKKRPKNRRSGCLYCKYWKINGISRLNTVFERFSDHKRRFFAKNDAENTENTNN